MTPNFTAGNQADRSLGYAEAERDALELFPGIACRANGDCHLFGDFVASMRRTFLRLARMDHVVAVPLVIFARYVFKIFKAAVDLHAILVVDFLAARRLSDEGEHNELVNLKALARFADPIEQLHARVAMRTRVGLEADFGREQRFHIAHIAHEIFRKVGNWSPRFHAPIVAWEFS